MNRWRAEL